MCPTIKYYTATWSLITVLFLGSQEMKRAKDCWMKNQSIELSVNKPVPNNQHERSSWSFTMFKLSHFNPYNLKKECEHKKLIETL